MKLMVGVHYDDPIDIGPALAALGGKKSTPAKIRSAMKELRYDTPPPTARSLLLLLAPATLLLRVGARRARGVALVLRPRVAGHLIGEVADLRRVRADRVGERAR